jgi:hypothetical protein
MKTYLTKHFTLEEMTKTSVKGVLNKPDVMQVENLRRVCEWLEELRLEWNNVYGDGNDPIVINSGYRSPMVNKAVGGVYTSNHLSGCAVDIRVSGIEQALRYAVILMDTADRRKKDFDELIIERAKNTMWVHFAVRAAGNRRKIMLSTK